MLTSALKLFLALSLVANAFLIVHLFDTTDKHRKDRINDQDKVTRSARLIVQSATQTHPLFAWNHATEARYILNDTISRYGDILSTEKSLRLPSGKLDLLQRQITEQHESVETYIMEKIIGFDARFDTDANDMAGLTRRRNHYSNDISSSTHD